MKNKIEEIRKERGIRQEEFAKSMGVSRQTISSLENGRYNPSILLAYKIAKYFDMGDLCALCAPRGLVVVSGAEDGIFPIEGAKVCVEVGREAFKAVGREQAIVHVIGAGGHRFYADDSWPDIHRLIDEL